MSIECVFCFGSGIRYVEIMDANDVPVPCDDCHGTGIDWDSATEKEREQALEQKARHTVNGKDKC